MSEEEIALHQGQMQIIDTVLGDNGIYYIICPSGRQFGKTHAVRLLLPAMGLRDESETGEPLKFSHILYIAPSQKLAKNLMWFPLLELTREMGVYKKSWENDLILQLTNDRKIYLLGADKPQSLRGYSPSFVAVDEAVDIKKEAIMEALWPAMTRLRAKFLMIGTPQGKGGVFYEFFKNGMNPDKKMWKSFNFPSVMNPTYDAMALAEAKETLPAYLYDQEYNAQFVDSTGTAFTRDMFKIVPPTMVPHGAGNVYVMMDPAGFGTSDSKSKDPDEHAIAAVRIDKRKWYVLEIQHGRWGTREAALRYLKMLKKYYPTANGIEGGSLKNAMHDPLNDMQRSFGLCFEISALSAKKDGHSKEERIRWAIQGRAEAGNIYLQEGPWNEHFINQACDFPSKKAHDDLLDAVAYADQLSKPVYYESSNAKIQYIRRR